MRTGLIYFSLITVLSFGCTSERYSPEIEDVLRQAGKNRGQLEKVLQRYSNNPADSLKLRATEFLIKNMPGKYSKYYDAPWEDVATVSYLLNHVSNKEKLIDDYHIGQPVVQEDINYITAQYLINNIEMAFQSWERAPWRDNITFDVFCDEILPYRILDEPLDNWREQVLASFADVYSSLLNSDKITIVEACKAVNAKLPSFVHNQDFPSMTYRQLMASTIGSRVQQANLATFVMRSMAIPVTWDVMLQPSLSYTNLWSIVCDDSGRHIPFIAISQPSGEWVYEDSWIMSKVYRHTFQRQAATTDAFLHIAFPFDNMRDVSFEYDNVKVIDTKVTIQTESIIPPPEYAYLAITNSLSEWTPVCWGKYSQGAYHFTSLGVNTLYLPVIYDANGRQIPFNQPFFLTDEGKIIYFELNKHTSSDSLSTYPRWRDVRYKTTGAEKTIDNLSGRWLFEDTTNYGKATVGNDLVAYKMTEDNSTGSPSTIGLRQMEGPKTGKKAVRVQSRTYFKCMHGIRHNGVGKNINEYTIMMDVKLPTKSPYCFFQTNIDNTDDVDIFLYNNLARFGISRFYCYFDPPLRENEWYRLTISARLGQSLKYYLNGELMFVNYNTKHGMLDSRLSLSKEALLLFADNSYEDSAIDVSEVAIFSRALTDEEVFSLGSAGNEWTQGRIAPTPNEGNDN